MDAINAFFKALNEKGPIIAGRVGVTSIGVVTIILGLAFLMSGSSTVQGVAKSAVAIGTKGVVKA